MIDFCSNDYLGFARDQRLRDRIFSELQANTPQSVGATGSRLISGNSGYIEDLERSIASYHRSKAGLIYNSGYDANLGLFSCLPQKGDTVIIDELAHASIIDGIRLSFANRYTFAHNNIESLEEKLRNAKGICYVVIESIYSMDGDTPPIAAIIALTEKYNVHLIVDEAHAIGLYPVGLVQHLGLQDQVFARVITFGKALGCHGAIVLGSDLLRRYLINFSRSFIYTTAPSFHEIAAIKIAYQFLGEADPEIALLRRNISLFKEWLIPGSLKLIGSDSAIQCLIAGNNENASKIAAHLQQTGLDVRAILSPTVARGSERLRICLHAFNTNEEIKLLADTLNNFEG